MYKDKLADIGKYAYDFIGDSTTPVKEKHDMAQSVIEAKRIIEKLTVENQIVLDCFMGSGTTGIASMKLGRKFIDIEIDEGTFNIAKANILKSNLTKEIQLN